MNKKHKCLDQEIIFHTEKLICNLFFTFVLIVMKICKGFKMTLANITQAPFATEFNRISVRNLAVSHQP